MALAVNSILFYIVCDW